MASREKLEQITISAADAQQHLDDLLRRTQTDKTPIIIEMDGTPQAVLIPMEEYQAWVEDRLAREKAARIQQFQQLAREFGEALEQQGITEEALMAYVDTVRQRLYEENYGDAPRND